MGKGVARQYKNRDSIQRGAVGSKIALADRWRGFISHHRATLNDSALRMFREPLQTIITSAVIAIALSLPATLYLMVENIRQLGSNFESFARITVYVEKNAGQRAINALGDQLEAMPEVATATYISAEQALTEFKSVSGFGSALQHLEDNPLPAVFIVEPALAEQIDVGQTHKLLEKIRSLAAIDDVQMDMLWLQRLRGLTEIGQKIVLALGGALGLGVLLIIGNTIRLAIHSRRDEIVIIKLVGGTDAYVRRPFLYGGMLLGLTGALGSSLMLFAGLLWLSGSIEHLSDLYNSQYRLLGPGFVGFLGLAAVGGLLGVCGAWLAVARHLKDIKPR